MTDLANVKGQEHVKRALEVTMAGGHSLLMIGPPGWGKTLIANSVLSIRPDDSASIEKKLSVCVLDNLPALRRQFTLRIRKTVFVATMRPCPCGFFRDPEVECTCDMSSVIEYYAAIPSVLKFDIYIDVPRMSFEKLTSTRPAEESQKVRARIGEAWAMQEKRFGEEAFNSDMGLSEIYRYCNPHVTELASINLLKSAMTQLQLDARMYHSILKLSRTIADLAGSENVEVAHLAEAIQYRQRIKR